jgi:triacylglycerol esterase/lipase EstA (alpha/beta hydrolase family)
VVLVHGYLDSDRSPWWDVLTGYLTDAGWPAERVHRVEIGNLPGTTVGSPRAYARDVEAELERVHDAHGEPASVLCHSMGGLDTRWCVEQLDAAPLVDDVVTLGTPHRGTYAAYLGLLPRAAGSWSLVVTSSRS